MTDEREPVFSGSTKAFFLHTLKEARSGSFIPCVVAGSVLVILLLVPLIAFSADIIQIVESDYWLFVLLACACLVFVVFVAIFLTLFWESSTKSLLEENEQLKSELAHIKEGLAVLVAHNNDLRILLQTVAREKGMAVFFQLETSLEKLLSEAKFAGHFKQKTRLLEENLKTTYVQINDHGGLSVSLPVGKQQGVVNDLVFSLHRKPETAHSRPSFLGKAIVNEIEDTKSFAVVEPIPIQEAYWVRVLEECRDQGHGYTLELEARPFLQTFQDYPPDVLDGIQKFIEELIKQNKENLHHTLVFEEPNRFGENGND